MSVKLLAPTSQQCSDNSIVNVDGVKYTAAWYPQMGGYVGKCLITPESSTMGPCFQVYVWHDGAFPFDDDYGDGVGPVSLHHCAADQFIEFGELLNKVGNVD